MSEIARIASVNSPIGFDFPANPNSRGGDERVHEGCFTRSIWTYKPKSGTWFQMKLLHMTRMTASLNGNILK